MRRDPDLALLTLAGMPLGAMPQAPAVGTLMTAATGTAPRVCFEGAPEDGVPARSCVALSAADCGKQVVLLFEGNDARRPLVMGVLRDPAEDVAAPAITPVVVTNGQEELRLSAQRQIVLECGEASLTLTQAGKVLIKGSYVLTSSSGTNRIRGGSVEIN